MNLWVFSPDSPTQPMAEQGQGEVTEQLCGASLAAGDKPWLWILTWKELCLGANKRTVVAILLTVWVEDINSLYDHFPQVVS